VEVEAGDDSWPDITSAEKIRTNMRFNAAKILRNIVASFTCRAKTV